MKLYTTTTTNNNNNNTILTTTTTIVILNKNMSMQYITNTYQVHNTHGYFLNRINFLGIFFNKVIMKSCKFCTGKN